MVSGSESGSLRAVAPKKDQLRDFMFEGFDCFLWRLVDVCFEHESLRRNQCSGSGSGRFEPPGSGSLFVRFWIFPLTSKKIRKFLLSTVF
jgi:hypothetical protein